MTDETTAVRHPKRGKAHREDRGGTVCGFRPGGTVRAMTERIPIDLTDPADRCKRCWPTTQPTTTEEPTR